jgi:hypothetical protein
MLETYKHLKVGRMRKILYGKLQHHPHCFSYKCNNSNDNNDNNYKSISAIMLYNRVLSDS